jgi:hypothetical protein
MLSSLHCRPSRNGAVPASSSTQEASANSSSSSSAAAAAAAAAVVPEVHIPQYRLCDSYVAAAEAVEAAATAALAAARMPRKIPHKKGAAAKERKRLADLAAADAAAAEKAKAQSGILQPDLVKYSGQVTVLNFSILVHCVVFFIVLTLVQS